MNDAQPAAGRLTIHDRETYLESYPGRTLAIGATVDVIRGNGPREGDRMGTATITGYDDGGPILDVHFRQ